MNQVISRADAKAQGLQKYFTGLPCNKRGHVSPRLVSNTKCVECNVIDHADWAKSNAQHLANYQKQYAANNKEAVTVHKSGYRSRNREKIREAGRLYYVENRDALLVKASEHKQRNYPQIAERMRRYNRENRGRVTALASKYRAAKLNAMPGWANLEAIREIYEEASRSGMEVDHVIPLQGRLVCGLHVENNLQILPRSLNRRKSSKFDPDVFLVAM